MIVGGPCALIDPVQRASIRDCLEREVVLELIAEFWEDLPGQLVELLAALKRGDAQGVADRGLHTLKGSAGSLGYAGIAEAAQGVRSAMRVGEAGAGEAVTGALARLRDAVRRSAAEDPDLAIPGLAGRLDGAWTGLPASA